MSSRGQGSENTGLLYYARPVAVSVLIGAVFCALALLLMSLLMSVIDVPQGAVNPMASVALMVGGFVAGLCCARMLRRNGLAFGAVCGLSLSLIMLLAGLTLRDNSFGISALLKIALILFSSMLGGVMGVNSKKRPRR